MGEYISPEPLTEANLTTVPETPGAFAIYDDRGLMLYVDFDENSREGLRRAVARLLAEEQTTQRQPRGFLAVASTSLVEAQTYCRNILRPQLTKDELRRQQG